MKLKTVFLFVLLALTLFIGVSAFAASWQAYVLPDGSICVTDEALPYEAIDTLTLGQNETRFIEVRSASEHRFESSSRYIKADEEGMLLGEGTGKATLRIFYTSSSFVEIRIVVEKAPASIKLDKTSINLNPEQTAQLKYTLNRGAAGLVSFYSADQDVVSVNEKGELKAINPGKTKIIVETYNGKSAECSVTVQAPPAAKIEVGTSFEGYAHEPFQLNAKLNGGYNETLSYESLNPDICTVSNDGTVFCLKEGIALINLTASGGNKTSCKVNVLPPATDIAAEKEKIYLYAGGTEILTATTVGGDGYFYAESLDESIAVAEDGVTVKALKPGVCSVRLSVYSEVSCLIEVHVLPFPSECALRVASTTIAEGESMPFTVAEEYTAAMPFAFESSAPSILRVDGNGTVTALSRGNAALIAYSGGFRQEVPIDVVPMARALSFDEKTVTLGVGDSMQLNLSYKDGAGTAIYSSSNEAAVRVDENGQITALAPGEATVTARLKNNVSASVQITVLPGAERLYMEQKEINVGQGDHFSLGFRFDEGAYSLINYTVEDDSLISWQSGNDFIASQSQGLTLVTASTAAGAHEQIWVNVINAPSEMRIDAEALTQNGAFTDYLRLPFGSRHELNIDFGSYTSVSYSCVSFDPEIASVDEKGTIEGLAPGTAHICVQSYNGLTRDILVEVTEA